MPIKDNDGEVIGVAQAVNKMSIRDMPFNEHDEKVSVNPLIRIALKLLLCPRQKMAEGHTEFTLCVCVCSRIMSGP